MWKLFLVAVICFEIAADVLSKEWSLNPKINLLLAGIGCYLASNLAWLYALKSGAGLARGVAIFSVASAVLGVLIGIYFYREKMGALETAGVILGVVSLALIFWNEVMGSIKI